MGQGPGRAGSEFCGYNGLWAGPGRHAQSQAAFSQSQIHKMFASCDIVDCMKANKMFINSGGMSKTILAMVECRTNYELQCDMALCLSSYLTLVSEVNSQRRHWKLVDHARSIP